MDMFLARIFDGFLDTVGEEGFTASDFMAYVKARWPKKTPTAGAAGHLCRRSARCSYDVDLRRYMLVN